MNGGVKRPRPDDETKPSGRPNLLLNTDELRKSTGQKYCAEHELLSLLLAAGVIRRVRTILVKVRPLSGESFDVRLNESAPTVREAKEQIEREIGTKPRSQLLCRVQVSTDGSNVRESDQEPEELTEDETPLAEGDVIAMGVLPECRQWNIYPENCVEVSEEGHLATLAPPGGVDTRAAMTHTGEQLISGRHYWEIELVDHQHGMLYLGVCHPEVDLNHFHPRVESSEVWLMRTFDGALYGNGKEREDQVHADGFSNFDRVGILLDLDAGTLRFYKNGVENGPGYPIGSVMGPVAPAAQLYMRGQAVRLIPEAVRPPPVGGL